jgi:hypothetical protein
VSGSTEHILETMVVPELKRIADALEVIALGSEVIAHIVKEIEAEQTRTVPAREVTKISSAPPPPPTVRRRAQV